MFAPSKSGISLIYLMSSEKLGDKEAKRLLSIQKNLQIKSEKLCLWKQIRTKIQMY